MLHAGGGLPPPIPVHGRCRSCCRACCCCSHGQSGASPAVRADAPLGRPILIKNACVISLDKAVGDFESADVLVRGSKIAQIAPNISIDDAEIIDASNTIVMPGFVDTHRHMWEGILRNIIPDASLPDYFRIIQRVLGPVYTPDDCYAANLLSALGAIDSGVTTVLDWSHIQNTPEHTDACIKALADSGIRAVFAYGSPSNASPDYRQDPKQKYPDDIRRLRKQYFSSDDQLLTLFLASLSAPPERIAETWAVARDVGAPISIHVGVGNFINGTVQKLGEMGVLKPDTTYIHCCTLNDTEWKMLVDSGGTVSMAGYVEMMMGHGTPPIQKALDLGLRPSLSIDVETSVPGDLFTQMRTVFALQRNDVFQRGIKGEKNLPKLLTSRDVLEFATIEGARANKLDRKVGTLTPGKEADLILLRTDRPNVAPVNNAVGAVVANMHPGNVDTVMVSGKILKRNGQLVGVDFGTVNKLAIAARDRTVAASKYERARF
ncbi:amidohydrolase family protein [Rhodopseudomonas sp. P2A-2r]|uniref:amidohydrolase family protein n=1 Tax=Rhodopseudomonas sp. P2A-2r TaxID=2991972 RepID=UPI002234355A|nr:amidohydrolase family protein [Rhodopseudomonas sp. P2A-2r]UZE50667.1 amidohydrolase family protein [Rhodopseudomonas sp. P2A-2r]